MTFLFLRIDDEPYYHYRIIEFLTLCFPDYDFGSIKDLTLPYLMYVSNDNEIRSLARIDTSVACVLVYLLAVAPDNRRTGVATQLLQECERRFGSYQVELPADCGYGFSRLKLAAMQKPYISDGLKLMRLTCMLTYNFYIQNEVFYAYEHAIRFAVFVDEQCFSVEEELDEYENECVHCLMKRNEESVACCRMRLLGEYVKLERFAVYKHFRYYHFGFQLMQQVKRAITGKLYMYDSAVRERITNMRGRAIKLHSYSHCVGFYERCGFRAEGKQFLECGASHQAMVWHE